MRYNCSWSEDIIGEEGAGTPVSQLEKLQLGAHPLLQLVIITGIQQYKIDKVKLTNCLSVSC